MIASRADLFAVLRQYNPWWAGNQFPDLPDWRRAAFHEIAGWLAAPPAGRALLLVGARQVGKTTLLLQAIEHLRDQGVPAQNILYATFDHPLLKLLGPEEVLRIWREFEPAQDGPEYLFLDEIQSTKDWQTWLKHQVDFEKRRRIAVTGSATPLTRQDQESGVGRWQTVRLATLSFYEYLQIRKVSAPPLPSVSSLRQLFEWTPQEFARVAESARPITGLFHEYLVRGGFPQCATVASSTIAQKLLREDIVDKVLKRARLTLGDMDRIEFMEAFAVTIAKFLRDRDADPARVNVSGGHLAKGHPMGASGAILTSTLLDALDACDGRHGLVVLTGAMGVGAAMIVERIGTGTMDRCGLCADASRSATA